MKQTIAYQDALKEYKDQVYTYLFYMLKSHEDAEDIMQEVFIKLWNNWQSVDMNRIKSWLLRVAHNRAIDLIRQKKTVRSQEKITSPLEWVEHRLVDGETPETQLESREKQNTVLNALDTLPDKTKSILLLHYFEGFKYHEIADQLNMSVSAVKVSVHRGKKILRDTLYQNQHTPMRGASHGVSV